MSLVEDVAGVARIGVEAAGRFEMRNGFAGAALVQEQSSEEKSGYGIAGPLPDGRRKRGFRALWVA